MPGNVNTCTGSTFTREDLGQYSLHLRRERITCDLCGKSMVGYRDVREKQHLREIPPPRNGTPPDPFGASTRSYGKLKTDDPSLPQRPGEHWTDYLRRVEHTAKPLSWAA
ncbi:MAG: hypothetical protein HQ530_05730 [Parcubacteria group bacterium]|nr:hypothetical protein [Parcubacteria group bacterium]